MENNLFSISKLIVLIHSDSYHWKKIWRTFRSKTADPHELEISWIKLLSDDNLFRQVPLEMMDDELILYESDIFLVNKEWSRGRIVSAKSQNGVELFILRMFYAAAVKKKRMFMHSSLIDIKGKGIMFLGPSGIGKTTQAELWNKYRDALIINGDVVLVQETLDTFLGWGTPWHGYSPYCENTSVPVAAMVVLKQAPKNSIRELTGFEKVTEVSNSVFYPQWVEGGMELCLETLDHLLTKIPVYELSCRPDEGAVELVEQVVFGHVQ